MGEAPDHPHNAARNSFIEVGGKLQPAPAPRGRRLPIVLALGAAGLGLAYVVRSKLRGDAAPESFPPPIAQPAAATAARTTARPEPAEHEPVAATASEEPREPKAATPESDAAGD
jgi:hypothetical protein